MIFKKNPDLQKSTPPISRELLLELQNYLDAHYIAPDSLPIEVCTPLSVRKAAKAKLERLDSCQPCALAPFETEYQYAAAHYFAPQTKE